MTNDIIYCGGKYEVHPGCTPDGQDNGTWCVVNSETGAVARTYGQQSDAVTEATRLNAGE